MIVCVSARVCVCGSGTAPYCEKMVKTNVVSR